MVRRPDIGSQHGQEEDKRLDQLKLWQIGGATFRWLNQCGPR